MRVIIILKKYSVFFFLFFWGGKNKAVGHFWGVGSVAPFSGFSEIWKLGIKVNFGKQFLFVAFSYPFFFNCVLQILCGDFWRFFIVLFVKKTSSKEFFFI